MIDSAAWAPTAIIIFVSITGLFLSGEIRDARDRILEEIRKEKKP